MVQWLSALLQTELVAPKSAVFRSSGSVAIGSINNRRPCYRQIFWSFVHRVPPLCADRALWLRHGAFVSAVLDNDPWRNLRHAVFRELRRGQGRPPSLPPARFLPAGRDASFARHDPAQAATRPAPKSTQTHPLSARARGAHAPSNKASRDRMPESMHGIFLSLQFAILENFG